MLDNFAKAEKFKAGERRPSQLVKNTLIRLAVDDVVVHSKKS